MLSPLSTCLREVTGLCTYDHREAAEAEGANRYGKTAWVSMWRTQGRKRIQQYLILMLGTLSPLTGGGIVGLPSSKVWGTEVDIRRGL